MGNDDMKISKSVFSVLLRITSKVIANKALENTIDDATAKLVCSSVESSEGSIICSKSIKGFKTIEGDGQNEIGKEDDLANRVWNEINQLEILGGGGDKVFVEAIRGMEKRDLDKISTRVGKNNMLK